MISPIFIGLFRPKYLIFKILFIWFLICGIGALRLNAQVLTCPDDYVVNLPQNQCSVAIFYDTVTWSADFPAQDPVFFPFPGSSLPTGVTTVTLAVSDDDNNFFTCDFEVNVVAFNSTDFDCPGIVSVSLNGECERMLTATDILGNVLDPCDQDYTLEIQVGGSWVPAIINAEDIGDNFALRITNFETGHSCETIINVAGGEPSSITCPSNVVQYCNEPTDTSHTGAPELTGCFDDVDLSFTDNLTFTQCPDSFAFQIIRTWVAVSPNGSQSSCAQMITGKRFPLNQVVFPLDLDGLTSPALACEDSLNLPQTASPDVTGWPLVGDFPPDDNIHCKFAVSYIDNITHLCGDSYSIKRAWSVVNLCSAATRRDTQTILVLDNMPPQFEIPDTLFFSNSSGCLDSVYLPAANVTSECSSFAFLIHSDWGDFTSNGQWIYPDTLPGNYLVDYTLTDVCGNDTTQTLVLKITDSSLVACPPTDTITCDYYFAEISPAIQLNDLDILNEHGVPTFYNNCSFDITQTATADVNSCGVGTVTRNIQATNGVDTISCEQAIEVVHVSNFIVHFQADTALCVNPLNANLPDPVITLNNCESLSPTFIDEIVPSGVTGCYTIERTWYFINECIFADTITGPDVMVSPLTFQDNGDGYMEYTQLIHVNNNAPLTFPNGCEMPDLYLTSGSCVLDLQLPMPVVEGCGDGINLTVSGGLGNQFGVTVGVTPGSYSVSYKAVDGCGKMKVCATSFEVFDTIAPTAICSLVYVVPDLPNPGYIEILASELNNGSFDNCNGNLDFSYSTDPYDIFKTFTCDDLGMNTVTIWVTDVHGNQNTCTGVIDIQNASPCTEPPILAGKVHTEFNQGIENVKVTITNNSNFNAARLTDANGNYDLDVIANETYTITPEKDTMPLNGVTTFDLVLIRRHILGSDTLNSPYKIIAADINNSGTVTTFDIVEIRKLILIINTDFPNNTSWRFVDAAYVFPNPMDPFLEQFPESITVDSVSADLINLDFIGIKIGDVNNSASTSPFTNNESGGNKDD